MKIEEKYPAYLKRAYKQVLFSAQDALLSLFEAATIAALAPFAWPALKLYCAFIQGRSNCLLWAVGQKLKSWRVVDIIRVKNSRGRSHWQIKVRQTGDVYEWYAKGASQRGRLANLWYAGEIKLVKRGKA